MSLLDLLKIFEEPDIQKMENENDVEGLLNLIKTKRISPLRVKITQALINIGEPAVDPLINALDDKKWEVRAYAAEVLGQIGSKKALDALNKKLEDDNYIVSETARESIWHINKCATVVDIF
ncbi:hypothetical protein CUJ83_09715 [Methanocella sp. CWC-04]|uniref:HEAT repeat-containing protein n=1 Tax=Methanooceanicella nereidis TaxID=2052831 RepID=A0AAP2W5A7_9EURY|nr:HEAT repeat domain-containing protein [Methanocella sp. CWC-04]MCD1295275.1 hypothetical protein [Methanocella sp. CWC-04]